MLNKKQLAKELNVSVSMINHWLSKGLPHIKIGRNVRFELEEVKKWFKERK